MNQPASPDVRCSAVVFRGPEVLLVRRVRDGGDDWVLPGGTPRPGESMAACVRRETLEETGLRVEPGRVAFVLETQGSRSGLHTFDLVFLASLSVPGLEPDSSRAGAQRQVRRHRAVASARLAAADRGSPAWPAWSRSHRTAAYLGNIWRPRRRDDALPTLVEFDAEQAARGVP